MARPIRPFILLAVLVVVAGCSSDDGAADEPTGTAAATTTEVATTTAAPTTTSATTTTTVPTTTTTVAPTTTTAAAAEQIHGTWLWEEYGAYEEFAEDGTWGVWSSADLEGDPYDWGTYTFDGEMLVMTNAEGSYCPGSVATFTVGFSDDGQEAGETLVEDTCTKATSDRGQDRVLIRQTP